MDNTVRIHLGGMGVLVTASTRGIGFFVAKGLAEMGARVVVVGRRRDSVERAVDKIKSRGGSAWGIVADLSTRQGLEEAFEGAWSILKGLDALVFNIGNVDCEPCYLHEVSYDDWVEAAKLHLIAPGYLSTLYVKKLLEKGKRGVIVFLSSVSVREPMPHFVLADTARAGLVQLAKSIALRYAEKGIRAYTILMGSFDTPGARKNIAVLGSRLGLSPEEAWKMFVIEKTPLKRTGRPEELSTLIAYLLSDVAEYMNGATLTIDGVLSRCAV